MRGIAYAQAIVRKCVVSVLFRCDIHVAIVEIIVGVIPIPSIYVSLCG